MIRKFNNISAVFLIMVFLLPSLIKLEHHHESTTCHEKNEKHLHTLHEKCAICSFEFSVFIDDDNTVISSRSELVDNFCTSLYNSEYSDLPLYSFLLRAPPVFANLT